MKHVEVSLQNKILLDSWRTDIKENKLVKLLNNNDGFLWMSDKPFFFLYTEDELEDWFLGVSGNRNTAYREYRRYNHAVTGGTREKPHSA